MKKLILSLLFVLSSVIVFSQDKIKTYYSKNICYLEHNQTEKYCYDISSVIVFTSDSITIKKGVKSFVIKNIFIVDKTEPKDNIVILTLKGKMYYKNNVDPILISTRFDILNKRIDLIVLGNDSIMIFFPIEKPNEIKLQN